MGSGSPLLPPVLVEPGTEAWELAQGGYRPSGQRTSNTVDNTLLWIAADFLKRRSVLTSGFVDLTNPHRMPDDDTTDPRLGPFPRAQAVDLSWFIDRADLDPRDGGTITVAFRAAGPVDYDPWRWRALGANPALKPDRINFPLDPLKACDAHIRKFDDRKGPIGAPREDWTHLYNRRITDYFDEPERAFDADYLGRYGRAEDPFTPRDVRYLNWRLVLENGSGRGRPTSPIIDTFALAYRLEDR